MDRRRFLALAGAAGVAATTATAGPGAPAPAGARSLRRLATAAQVPPLPFTLGVASGDPVPDGVVLWTRLAPDPLVPGGGMPPTAG